MAFFRTVGFAETAPSLDGQGVILRLPQMADFEEWAELRAASRDFLVPWEPTWPADDLTRGAFRRRLKRYAEDWRADQSYAFFAARQHPARRRPGRQHRLLDGRALCALRPHDRGGADRASVRVRDLAAAPGRG